MDGEDKDLGRAVAVYGIAPATLQRAVFVVILSFLFFLVMMFTYYIRQSLVYFLLASAFLALYLITLFSWVMLRRSVVTLYVNGVSYKDRRVTWRDIKTIDDAGSIHLFKGKPLTVPATLDGREQLLGVVRHHALTPRP